MAEALHVIYVNQSDHSFHGRPPGDLEWVFCGYIGIGVRGKVDIHVGICCIQTHL